MLSQTGDDAENDPENLQSSDGLSERPGVRKIRDYMLVYVGKF